MKDIAKPVMEKVVRIEKKRIRRFILLFFSTFIILISLSAAIFTVIAQNVLEDEIQALIVLFNQDRDLFFELWKEFLFYVTDVAPPGTLFAFCAVVALLVSIFLYSRKKRTIISKKIRTIKVFEKEKRSVPPEV